MEKTYREQKDSKKERKKEGTMKETSKETKNNNASVLCVFCGIFR